MCVQALPSLDPTPARPNKPAQPGILSRMTRSHTILLVDDEPEIREVVVKTLADPRYNVLVASDGYEAIRLLWEHWVDLLITDVRMPGSVDGFQLARQAKLMRPNLHVLYISAYHSAADQSAGPTYGPLLEKPVRPAALLEEIDRELA
jgi:CheY-like chemotaxis protein